jgi:hypothetical protein
MKFSKSAMRVRQVRVAHLTQMPAASETIDERPPGRPRTFSTDRTGGTNGVVLPEQLRQRIDGIIAKAEPEPDEKQRPSFTGWGFF